MQSAGSLPRKNDFFERNLKWKKAIELDCEQKRQEKESRNMQECSFQPHVPRSPPKEPDFKKINIASIKTYLDRQQQARENKAVVEIREMLRPGSGKLWKNKLTRPSAPKLAVSQQQALDNIKLKILSIGNRYSDLQSVPESERLISINCCKPSPPKTKHRKVKSTD